MKTATLLLGILCLASATSHSQDTCQVFSIPNPHGAAMTISRVWIQDSVNFSVEPLRSVPFDITATESWDARVCIKPRDGQTYSTIIRYQTTHGPAAFQISMVAPNTSAVHERRQFSMSEMRVSPLPTSGDLVIAPSAVSGDILTIEVYDGIGIVRSVMEERFDGNPLRLDLSELPSGGYRIVVRGRDGVVNTGSALLVR